MPIRYGTTSQYDVSEAEIRWQVFTSLALGAKGVLYFCYWTPPGFPRGQAIMTPTPGSSPDVADQSPSHKYAMAATVNSKLKTYGEFLLNSTSSAVVQAHGNRSSSWQVSAGQVVSINGSDTGPEWSFLLGFFDGNSTMVLVNQDSNHPALASLELVPRGTTAGAEQASFRELDPASGTLWPARDDAPFMPSFQVALLAGGARVFRWV